MPRILSSLFFLLTAYAWAQGPIEIIRATYGAGRTQTDVTEKVRAAMVNGAIQFVVRGENLGGDPVPNTPKTLTVIYRENGARQTIRVKDFDTLSLGITFKVTKALYGDGRRMRDVTDILNTKVTANRLELAITNANLGGDPAPAVKKFLTVEYTYNGVASTARTNEGETLVLPSGSVAAAPSAPTINLRVLRATYSGGRRNSADVTTAVAARVAGNVLEFPVNSTTLNTDPAPGVIKTLTVEYELNGQRQFASAKDGETLRLNAPAPALKILRATYTGGRRASADVTNAVASRVNGNTLELTVNGDTLGVDPAPGTVKTLTIEYELNGQRQTATAKDAELVILPGITSFTIYSATYGAQGRTMDATRAVTARVSNNRLEIPVTSDTLGGDPAPGIVKNLTVDYELNGRRRTATAQDGETLRLPGGGIMTPVVKAPMAEDVVRPRGVGVCIYRQPNYTGESVCGAALPAITNGQSGFRSLRLNGAQAVDIFEQTNYGGRTQAFTSDVPDLLQVSGAWWRYESSAPIQSLRAR